MFAPWSSELSIPVGESVPWILGCSRYFASFFLVGALDWFGVSSGS